MEELFLSTGMFQRSSKDRVKRPRIVPRRFKKNASSRQDSGDEDSGSLEEVFLSTGVFQRGENDTVQRQRAGVEELRRHRRQVSGQNCVAVLRNECEDAVVQQCQVGTGEHNEKNPDCSNV